MTRISIRLTAAFAFMSLTTSASAERTSIGDSWPLLAIDRAGDCELTIASAGHAMQLRAEGLIPGEALRFVLTNGDMKPIAITTFADNSGRLMRYYLPFRFNREGGTVQVSIAAARCNLSSAAKWNRALHTIE